MPSSPGADSINSDMSLQKGDEVFIRRSGGIFTYATVAKVAQDEVGHHAIFTVEPDGSTKRVNKRYWGDRVMPLSTRVKAV